VSGTPTRHGDTNQLGRRNLTDYQRAEVALLLEGLFKSQAKARQGARTDLQAASNIVENLPPSEDSGKSRDAIAAIANVSGRTIDKVKAIQRDAIAVTAPAQRKAPHGAGLSARRLGVTVATLFPCRALDQ